MIQIKKIISKCLQSVITKYLLWILPIMFSGASIFFTNILQHRVNKIENPVIAEETNHVKDSMYLLTSRCGAWTGMVWGWIKTDKNNNKSLGFNEAIAFDEILNEPRSVYYENKAYRNIWALDEKAYGELSKVLSSSFLLLDERNPLWSESPFFFGIRPMIWSKSNARRAKQGLDTILVSNIYISVVKKYDNIIYIIALSLPQGKSFCTLDKDNEYYNSVEKTGKEVAEIANKLKLELGLN